MEIEVIYALPDKQVLLELEVDNGASIEQAIQSSGLLTDYPDIDLTAQKVGVFGKVRKLTDSLHPGDRVEIYRPLIADPKESRKKRAEKAKK